MSATSFGVLNTSTAPEPRALAVSSGPTTQLALPLMPGVRGIVFSS